MIGYLCAMLRYYYPLEFITAFLNCSDTEDDISSGAELANRKKIKINGIKFRHSKDKYFMDKTNNSIYKGVSSVKFLNENVANELFNLGKKKYSTFSDLLYDINNKTSCNSRQLDILIKLDYFSEFGNSQELLSIVSIMDMFKFGEAKTFNKAKIEDGYIKNAIAKYSLDKNNKGEELKSYKILDCDAIIKECEKAIHSMTFEDFSYSQKASFQQEFLGYISLVSGNEEDRPKLYVKDIYPVKRKKDGKIFAKSIIAQSIGSGKQNRFTIFNAVIERCGDIIKGDVIYCRKYSAKGEYFNIDDYEIMI